MSGFSGAGLTYRRPVAAGSNIRRRGAGLTYRAPVGAGTVGYVLPGAGLTYRRPHGAGAMDSLMSYASGDDVTIADIGVSLGATALALLAQYYVIKWAVRAARKG